MIKKEAITLEKLIEELFQRLSRYKDETNFKLQNIHQSIIKIDEYEVKQLICLIFQDKNENIFKIFIDRNFKFCYVFLDCKCGQDYYNNVVSNEISFYKNKIKNCFTI